MSTVSKKREKRPSSSTDDYNSFVKNVTSRVSSFLPATITKWLSPSTSNSNGSAPAADVTDSSTEDEAPDPVMIQPPAKRMRFNPPEFNHFNTTEITCVNTTIDAAEPKYTASNTPEMSNSKMFFNSNIGLSAGPKRKSIFQITPKNESSKTSRAKVSKEADMKSKSSIHKPILLCSPFYPGQTMYGGASSTHVNQANIKQRKVALVNESKSSDNTVMSHSARRVMELLENASTPLMEAKRISQYINNSNNSTTNNSTTGASRMKYAPYSPKTLSYKTQELHVPNAASIMQLKQRSRLMDTTNAARQIIASHSSTTPYQPRSTESQRELEGEKTKDKFITKIKSRLNGPRQSSKEPEHTFITPLNLPTGVLQIGKDNMPTFTFTTTESKTPITKTNSTTTISPALQISTFKKHELNKQKEDTSPKLKDSVVINAIPQAFGCGKQNTKEPKLSETVLFKPGLATFEPLTNNDSYKFSSPVRISNEISMNTSLPAKFTFGSPERSIDKKSIKDKKDNNSLVDDEPTINDVEGLSNSKSKNWQCSNCSFLNESDISKCVSCGANKFFNDIVTKTKCTVCMLVECQNNKDKCLNCEKIQSPTINCDLSKWTCQDCWVKNDQNVEKCVCCGGINSNKSASTQKSTSAMISENASTETDWKCDSCWIKNKNNVDKCAACGESKPGAKQKVSMASFSKSTVGNIGNIIGSKTDNSLKHIVKLQSEKWNCPTCLVSNENDKARCVCCDFEKPGTVKESSNLKNVIHAQTDKWECPSCLVKNEKKLSNCVCCQFEKPGTVKETKNFKNIIKNQTEQWECPSCLVRNENNRSKCVCCEFEKPGTVKESSKTSFNFTMNTKTTFKFGIDSKTQEVNMLKKPQEAETNNNVLPKAPSFTFGIPSNTKKDEDQTDATKEPESKENPKINFTFGIPKAQASSEPAVVAPIFLSPNKVSDCIPNKVVEVKEKPQEVPKIEFTLPKPKESPKPLPAIFGSHLNSQANQGISITGTISLNPTVTVESKDTSSNPLVMQPAVTSTQVTQSHNIFGFASPGLKPAVNLFAAPAATTLSFTSSVQTTAASTSIAFFKKPDTTTSPFQKADPITTSTVSLFQKPDNTTTVAPPSMATTAPVFSFGTNGAQSVAPQQEKPKFNFTFGGMNPLFSNTFNASTDVNTNKFDISGNGIGTGNSGLSAGSALPGNGLTVNKLGSNELPTNHSTSGVDAQVPGSGLFVTPVQKENLWLSATSNSTNSFVSTSSTSLPKPATFTFGSSMPFNANAPTFGGNQTPAQSMFGMNQSSSSQPSMFSNPVHNQTAPCLFGSPQPATNPTPGIGLFGSASVGASPSFGAPRPAFEVPSITPAPTPAFNFNASQQNGVFGMVQQPPQPQGQQAGMYNFAVSPGGAPQFNIGSAPNTAVRRVRKAVRRNSQR